MAFKTQKEREQQQAWESWEPLLRTRLDQWIHFLEAIKSDLSAAGMSKKKSDEFLHGKISEMIAEMDAKPDKKKAV